MGKQTFKIVNAAAMLVSIGAALLSSIGISITGFYPGIAVLFLVALIAVASKLYAKKLRRKPDLVQRKYYTMLTIVNVIAILLIIFMCFVILHDRVLKDS